MRSFRLALIGLFIVAGALGCAKADPWVGEWRVVVDIEAEVAEFVELQEERVERQVEGQESRREFQEGLTDEGREELASLRAKGIKLPLGLGEPIIDEEPIDIEKKAEELAAELRAIPEDEGKFLTFERGRDGVLVAVYETRGAEDPANNTRMLSEEVTESSELIRCKFLYAEWGITLTYELKLVSEDLLEGSLVFADMGVSEKEPVKLKRVR